MNKKTWSIFVVICVVILGGLVALSQKDKVDVSKINLANIQKASTANGHVADHVFGKADSKVILVEYGDFQCPYCGEAYPNVKKIAADYSDKIAFVFRNYPLSTMHPNAKAAAGAAEAAGLQGKYWEMHDKLYETQSTWENDSTDQRTTQFTEFAKEIGVKDLKKFKTDMASNNVNKKINFDLALGDKAGVTGTPTFVLDGKKVSDSVSSSLVSSDGGAMRTAIDNALK